MLTRDVLFAVLLYCFIATIAHFVVSLGQTLFHRYLGHCPLGGKFAVDHIHFHHGYYFGDHVTSKNYLDQEKNNTPFFLIPIVSVAILSYFLLPLDMFSLQLTAMSISFYAHIYIDKQYHVATPWLRRYSWFRRKQQLHFTHHRHSNCNFAVIDYFWDRLLGTYRSAETLGHRTAHDLTSPAAAIAPDTPG
jgi:sterol desaturase/sphingolipid hydroxylase (fatty acid hydroxylase superfamily)